MSRGRGVGINKLFEMFLNGTIEDTHHRTPREKGGSNKKSNKKWGSALKHRIWHFFVGNSLPYEAADICSDYAGSNFRFFAVDITNPQYGIVKINNWVENFGKEDYVAKISIKRRSKIIQFRPLNKDSLLLPKIVF